MPFSVLESNCRVQIGLTGHAAQRITIHGLLFLRHTDGLAQEDKTLLVEPFRVLELCLAIVHSVEQLGKIALHLGLQKPGAIIEHLLSIIEIAHIKQVNGGLAALFDVSL